MMVIRFKQFQCVFSVFSILALSILLLGCSNPQAEESVTIDLSQLIETEQYREATARINEALVDFPRDANLHYNLALIQRLQGMYDEAYLSLQKAKSYSPQDEHINLALSELSLETGKVQQAWDYFTALNQSIKNTADAQLLKGLIMSNLGDYQQADEALRTVIAMGEESPIIYAALAFILVKQNRTDEAQALLSQAESSGALTYDTRLQIAETYLAMGNAKQALTIAKQLQKQNTNDAKVYTLLGKANMLLLNFGEAESAFTRALASPNSTPWTRVHYATMLFASERESEAFAQAKEAETQLEISSEPISDPLLYNLLATLYAKRSQNILAFSYLNRSLQINPQQPKVRALLDKHVAEE